MPTVAHLTEELYGDLATVAAAQRTATQRPTGVSGEKSAFKIPIRPRSSACSSRRSWIPSGRNVPPTLPTIPCSAGRWTRWGTSSGILPQQGRRMPLLPIGRRFCRPCTSGGEPWDPAQTLVELTARRPARTSGKEVFRYFDEAGVAGQRPAPHAAQRGDYAWFSASRAFLSR